MHAIVAERLEEVEQLCREYRVRRLDLFGSAARGGFSPGESDLDFLVDFEPPTPGEYRRTYFGLLNALRSLFENPINLVDASAPSNPWYVESIVDSREPLYGS